MADYMNLTIHYSDRDHVWINGRQFVSLKRFQEVVKEVAKRKTGEWVPVTNGRGGCECNLCHTYAPSFQSGDEYRSNYCPNCGADMRGEP